MRGLDREQQYDHVQEAKTQQRQKTIKRICRCIPLLGIRRLRRRGFHQLILCLSSEFGTYVPVDLQCRESYMMNTQFST